MATKFLFDTQNTQQNSKAHVKNYKSNDLFTGNKQPQYGLVLNFIRYITELGYFTASNIIYFYKIANL